MHGQMPHDLVHRLVEDFETTVRRLINVAEVVECASLCLRRPSDPSIQGVPRLGSFSCIRLINRTGMHHAIKRRRRADEARRACLVMDDLVGYDTTVQMECCVDDNRSSIAFRHIALLLQKTGATRCGPATAGSEAVADNNRALTASFSLRRNASSVAAQVEGGVHD